MQNKKVYADYHGPRCTRQHDGELAQWKYHGIARKSKAEERQSNYNPDFILDNGLNDIAAMSYPIVGMQSQNDPYYIEYQILLAKIAKIDGFFVEWGFKEHKSNHELVVMFDIAAKYDFEIGINWCDAWLFYDWIEEFYQDATTREAKVELFKKNTQYLIDTVFSHETGAKYNGHPIIFLFGGGPTPEEFQEIISSSYNIPDHIKFPYFLTRAPIIGQVDQNNEVNYSLEDSPWIELTDGMFGWIPTRVRNGLTTKKYNKWDRYASKEDTISYLETLHRSSQDKDSKIKVSCVNPEMDNRACASWDKHDLSYIPREDGETYENMWKWNLDHKDDIDIAYIVSWNDYTERHQIEPTLAEGYREILTTQKYASLYKGESYDASAIKLPARLFQARKDVEFYEKLGFNLKDYHVALDDIAQRIANREYDQAGISLEGTQKLIEKLEGQVMIEELLLDIQAEDKDKETILFKLDEQVISQVADHYFKGYMSFDYLDDDETSFQIYHNNNKPQNVICDIKKDGSKTLKQGKLEFFKENMKGFNKDSKIIAKGVTLKNIRMHFKIYKTK